MKRKVVIFALIISFCLTLLPESASAAYEHERLYIKNNSNYKYDSKYALKAYKIFRSHIEDFAKGKTVTIKMSYPFATWEKEHNRFREAADNVRYWFDNDHPELFFGSIKEKYLHGHQNIFTGKMDYTYEYYADFAGPWMPVSKGGLGRNPWKDYKRVMKRAKNLAAKCRAAGSSRYDQLLYLHDWLVMNNAYNVPAYEDEEARETGISSGPDPSPTAFSALVPEFSPVCGGYARAFKLVCNELDIPCIVVDGGMAKNSDDWQFHAWDYVKMDNGRWYLVDVTWDDPVSSSVDWSQKVSGYERHTYFLRGEKFFSEDHSTGLHEANDYWPKVSQKDYDPADKPAA